MVGGGGVGGGWGVGEWVGGWWVAAGEVTLVKGVAGNDFYQGSRVTTCTCVHKYKSYIIT